MSTHNPLYYLNNEELISFLKKNGLEEFNDVMRAKAYDGSSLLKLAKFQLKLWTPKKTTQQQEKFWNFLSDVKKTPEKYFGDSDEDEIYENYKEAEKNEAEIFLTTVSKVCEDQTFISKLKGALEQRDQVLTSSDSFDTEDDEIYENDMVRDETKSNKPYRNEFIQKESNVKPKLFPPKPVLKPKPSLLVKPIESPKPEVPKLPEKKISSEATKEIKENLKGSMEIKPKSEESKENLTGVVRRKSRSEEIKENLKSLIQLKPKCKETKENTKETQINQNLPTNEIKEKPTEEKEDEESLPEYLEVDEPDDSGVPEEPPRPVPRASEKAKGSPRITRRPLPPLPDTDEGAVRAKPLPPPPEKVPTLPRPPKAIVDLSGFSVSDDAEPDRAKDIEDLNFEHSFVSKYSRSDFYRYTDRKGSERLLSRRGLRNGTFLVRPSHNHYCTVSVRHDDRVYQLAVHKGPGASTIVQADATYDNVEAYIQFHRTEPLWLPGKIGYVNVLLTDTLPPDST